MPSGPVLVLPSPSEPFCCPLRPFATLATAEQENEDVDDDETFGWGGEHTGYNKSGKHLIAHQLIARDSSAQYAAAEVCASAPDRSHSHALALDQIILTRSRPDLASRRSPPPTRSPRSPSPSPPERAPTSSFATSSARSERATGHRSHAPYCHRVAPSTTLQCLRLPLRATPAQFCRRALLTCS